MPRSFSILVGLLMSVSALSADIVQSNPFLPPTTGFYSLANTCVSVVCLENIRLTDFTVGSRTIVNGDEFTVSNADLKADLFKNNSGVPGAHISPIVLNGEIDITYFSKGTLSEQGTFNDEITFMDLKGSFVGLTGPHTVEAILNPLFNSTGKATVTPIIGSAPPAWKVSSFFDVWAWLKVDNGPFVAGPERVADLSELPEPGYGAALGLLSAGLMAGSLARRKRQTAA